MQLGQRRSDRSKMAFPLLNPGSPYETLQHPGSMVIRTWVDVTYGNDAVCAPFSETGGEAVSGFQDF